MISRRSQPQRKRSSARHIFVGKNRNNRLISRNVYINLQDQFGVGPPLPGIMNLHHTPQRGCQNSGDLAFSPVALLVVIEILSGLIIPLAKSASEAAQSAKFTGNTSGFFAWWALNGQPITGDPNKAETPLTTAQVGPVYSPHVSIPPFRHNAGRISCSTTATSPQQARSAILSERTCIRADKHYRRARCLR
jgi:hypothetical protein